MKSRCEDECRECRECRVLRFGAKQYQLTELIGSGTYSKVFLAVLTKNGSEVGQAACKVISKRHAGADFLNKFLPRELDIIRSISHPNIVNIYDVVEVSGTVYVFMYLCSNGDLLDYVRTRGALGERRAKYLFKQMVSAVGYLHGRDIAHRDLKCENIFLTGRRNVKIGDFGFARSCRNDRTGARALSRTFCGSAAYAAPEVLQGTAYNPKTHDVWSLGCVLYVMVSSRMPFDDSNVQRMLQYQRDRAVRCSIRHDARLSSALKALLYDLLEPDVTRRPHIRLVAACAWLRSSRAASGGAAAPPSQQQQQLTL